MANNDDDFPTYRDAPQPDNIDIDREMWTFYTPTPPVQREPVRIPAQANYPEKPNVHYRRPPGMPPFFQWFGVKDCPPNQCPGVWGQPVHDAQENCLTYYETEYTVYKLEVPDTRYLVITEIGYELQREKFPPGSVVEFRIKRDSEVMATWEEFVAVNPPNPALRYTFGSFLRPVPCKLRVDKNQTFTVSAIAKGFLPFNNTSQDELVGFVKVIAYGYLDQLRDTRDGAFKSRVDGEERGPGRIEMVPHVATEFLQSIDALMPYFTNRFDVSDSGMAPMMDGEGEFYVY